MSKSADKSVWVCSHLPKKLTLKQTLLVGGASFAVSLLLKAFGSSPNITESWGPTFSLKSKPLIISLWEKVMRPFFLFTKDYL